MLLMFEEGTRGGICQATHRYVKANNKYIKNHDKDKEPSYLVYVDANNLYGWSMCKKLPVSDFKYIDDISIFTEDFIKNYDENNDKENNDKTTSCSRCRVSKKSSKAT